MRRVTRWLLAAGYVLLALCGAAQWIHTLLSGQAQGLSGLFLVAYLAGLALLQVAFWVARERLSIQIGNALGLLNAGLMLATWWWAK